MKSCYGKTNGSVPQRPRNATCLHSLTHSLSSPLSPSRCCCASRAAWQLSPLAHNGKHNTQVEFVVCAINSTWRRFPLYYPHHTHTHTNTPWQPHSMTNSLSLLPAHRGRHHSCLSPRLCFIALRFGATKIVAYFAARPVNWVVLHSLNKSLDVRLRGYENMIEEPSGMRGRGGR